MNPPEILFHVVVSNFTLYTQKDPERQPRINIVFLEQGQ